MRCSHRCDGTRRVSLLFIVYALTDPRTGEVRYIGMSTSGLRRPRRHSMPSQLSRYPGHRANWIAELKRQGLAFGVAVLCALPSPEHLPAAEIFWIAEGRRLGWRLTNATDGGEGSPGYVPSASARALLSAAGKGRPHSPEHRAAISAALKGHKISDETLRKISESNTGRSMSALTKERIRAANMGNQYGLGRSPSPETRAKMSAARRGRKTAPEVVARMRGRTHSPETRAKIAAGVSRARRGGA